MIPGYFADCKLAPKMYVRPWEEEIRRAFIQNIQKGDRAPPPPPPAASFSYGTYTNLEVKVN